MAIRDSLLTSAADSAKIYSNGLGRLCVQSGPNILEGPSAISVTMALIMLDDLKSLTKQTGMGQRNHHKFMFAFKTLLFYWLLGLNLM